MCWLHGKSLYFGFLLPVGVKLLANIVFFSFNLKNFLFEKVRLYYRIELIQFNIKWMSLSFYRTRWRLYTLPFCCWKSSGKAMNTNFHSLCSELIGNETRVYVSAVDVVSTPPPIRRIVRRVLMRYKLINVEISRFKAFKSNLCSSGL